MAGTPWNDDDPADAALVTTNVLAIAQQIHANSPARAPLTLKTLQEWHVRLFAGCVVPVSAYVGNFRGDPSVPELVDYEVQVGGVPGVRAAVVEAQVQGLVDALNQALTRLDSQIPVGAVPDRAEIQTILLLCARVHGEWVRTHPFANGNGRTGRVIVAWLALRYGLPVFLSIKPRPATNDYAVAAQISMAPRSPGQDRDLPMAQVFLHMLSTLLGP